MAAAIHFTLNARPALRAHRHRTLSLALIASLSALANLAATAPATGVPDPQHGEVLYLRHCYGAGTDGGSAPRIGGQHFRYVLSRLREFGPTHRRPVGAVALSAAEQQALADDISRLPAGGSTP